MEESKKAEAAEGKKQSGYITGWEWSRGNCWRQRQRQRQKGTGDVAVNE